MLGVLGGSPIGAQQVGKTYRVGILRIGTSRVNVRVGVDAFRRTLAGLGYQEGKNLEILYWYAGGDQKRLPNLAADLVRAKPDVIVADSTPLIAAAKHATTSIPIVMVQNSDPIGSRLIASLARPGGNVTGMTTMSADLEGKRLQLLKELVPGLRRVAVVHNHSNPGVASEWRGAERVAHTSGIQAFAIDIRSADRIDAAMRTIPHLRADAIFVLADPMLTLNAASVVRSVAARKLPAIYSLDTGFAAAGGLIIYGASNASIWSGAATYVDRILKGAKPADLPVERPTIFELIVNLKTAHTLGITVPQSILLRADEVIR